MESDEFPLFLSLWLQGAAHAATMTGAEKPKHGLRASSAPCFVPAAAAAPSQSSCIFYPHSNLRGEMGRLRW